MTFVRIATYGRSVARGCRMFIGALAFLVLAIGGTVALGYVSALTVSGSTSVGRIAQSKVLDAFAGGMSGAAVTVVLITWRDNARLRSSRKRGVERDLRSGVAETISSCVADLRRSGDWTSGLLDGLNLSEIDLSGVDLAGCRMTRASFVGADLRGAILVEADLRAGDLTDANLEDATVFGCDLRGATLRRVSLSPGARVD